MPRVAILRQRKRSNDDVVGQFVGFFRITATRLIQQDDGLPLNFKNSLETSSLYSPSVSSRYFSDYHRVGTSGSRKIRYLALNHTMTDGTDVGYQR